VFRREHIRQLHIAEGIEYPLVFSDYLGPLPVFFELFIVKLGHFIIKPKSVPKTL
jgi:hypothetical protein